METTLNDQNLVLNEENKTKVLIIKDVNEAVKALTGRDISPEEFDMLYDSELNDLNHLLLRLAHALSSCIAVRSLSDIISKINRVPRNEERYRFGEEGD